MSSTTVISEGDIHAIATILIEDAELVQSKQKFYNSLGLPYGEFVDIERRAFFSGSSESYVFFNLALTKWIEIQENGATLDALLNTLKEENFNMSASILKTWTPDPTPTASFPSPSVGVFGRDLPTNGWLSEPVILPNIDLNYIYPRTQDGELITTTIQQSLEHNNTLVIHGPNGYGKSTIAISYAFLSCRKYSYMIWLEAKTLINLETNMRDLAHKLGIPSAHRINPLYSERLTPKTMGQLFEEIYCKLKGKKCLIVFDNMMIAEQIHLYLPGPQYTNDFHVVLTSPHQMEYFKNFELNVFVPEEAVHFLCKELGVTSDQEHEVGLVKSFAEKVGYVPLALQLLIIPEVSNISTHLKEYLDHKESVEIPNAQLQHDLPDYPDGVLSSFGAAINAAKNDLMNTFNPKTVELTIFVLYVMAFLDPENIPYRIFDWALIPGPLLPCLQVLVNRRILVSVQTSHTTRTRTIMKLSTVWQRILQFRLQNVEKPVKVNILKFGIKVGAQVYDDSGNELRDNLWEFAAVKTGSIFESPDLIKLCWRNEYFDSQFCKSKISGPHFFKLFFFRLLLGLKFWIPNILIPSLIGVALGRIVILPVKMNFLETLELLFFSIFVLIFGSILVFFIESIIHLQIKPGAFNSVYIPMYTMLAEYCIYTGVLSGWVIYIVPYEEYDYYHGIHSERRDEGVRKMFQMLVGLILIMMGTYRFRSFTTGWKRWLSLIILIVGTTNVVNGFIFTIWGKKSDPWLETVLLTDYIDLGICILCLLIIVIPGLKSCYAKSQEQAIRTNLELMERLTTVMVTTPAPAQFYGPNRP